MNGIHRKYWPAPAKLNLFLHVTGRREDGYHELQTLFQLIDWCDDLSIEADPSGRISRRAANYDVAPEEDLAVRAARALKAVAGVRAGAVIGVRKRIPLGAGLGGGSSNAATVLLVLNRVWQCGLGTDELMLLGQELGADVPVFIRGRSALAEGTGQALKPVTLGQRHYVLVLSPVAVSTAAAFADPDLERSAQPLTGTEALAGVGRNVFEPVIFKRYPGIAETCHDLRRWGAPRLTGTGSCLFLTMTDEASAKRTAQELKCRYNVRAVRGIDQSPVHEMLA